MLNDVNWVLGNQADQSAHHLILRMAECFEKKGITHRVVGFMASMIYAKPHFNNAVDMIADIPLETLDAFLRHS